MHKIAILDKYSLFSSGFQKYLNTVNKMKVVGAGGDTESLLMNLNGQEPDIIIINLINCQETGFRLLKRIKRLFPGIPVLLITNENNSDKCSDFKDYSVRGLIFSNDKCEDLVDAINDICNGKVHFPHKLKTKFYDIHSLQKNRREQKKPKKKLSDREMDVLKLFCDGLTYKEIGARLFISPRTVEAHKTNIMTKFNVDTKTEMVKYAVSKNFTSV